MVSVLDTCANFQAARWPLITWICHDRASSSCRYYGRKIGRFVADQPDHNPVLDVSAQDRRRSDEPEVQWEWSAEAPEAMHARDVRSACRNYLSRYSATDGDIGTAELIVAELVANVVRHAPGEASIHLDWRGRHPRLVVLDRGPGFHGSAGEMPADLYAESGRGLAIVRSLAIEMECGNRPDGGAFVRVTLPVERPVEADSTTAPKRLRSVRKRI